MFPALNLSSAGEGFLNRINKRGIKPLNAPVDNLAQFIVPTTHKARPRHSSQMTNLPERSLQILEKFASSLDRTVLFEFLRKHESTLKRELRVLTLENEEEAHPKKRSYDRQTVLALLSAARHG